MAQVLDFAYIAVSICLIGVLAALLARYLKK
jgi:hypothetical protein